MQSPPLTQRINAFFLCGGFEQNTRSFKRYRLRSSCLTHPRQLIHMDDFENTHTDCDLWADGMENIFVEMLYGDTLSGALRAGNITSRDHTTYAQRLTSVGIRVYDSNQVKGKLQRLKSRLRLFTNLMRQTGMAWGPDNKMVIAIDEDWVNALGAKSQWKMFWTLGCPMYEKLYIIFGASVATDTLHPTSTQPPLDSDDECALDAEMRHWGPALGNRHGLPIDFADMNFSMGYETPPSIASWRSQRRRQMVGPSMQVDADISNCLNEITRTTIARRKCYEERAEGTSNKCNKGTTSSNHDAHWNQHTQSVQLLQALDPPLPDDVFLRAFDKLLDTRIQTGFLALDDHHKRLWAMNCS